MEFSFKYNDKSYIFPQECIPENTLLKYMIDVEKIGNQINMSYIMNEYMKNNVKALPYTKNPLKIIHDYLVNGIYPHCDDIDIFDYFNIDPLHSYEMSCMHGEYMLKHIHNVDDDNIIRENHYALNSINEKTWDSLKFCTEFQPKLNQTGKLLFSNPARKNKRQFHEVQKALSRHDWIFKYKPTGFIIAGTSIFCDMIIDRGYQSEYPTVLYTYGKNEKEIQNNIIDLITRLKTGLSASCNVYICRKEKHLIIKYNEKVYIIPFKIYISASHVIHTMPIDCLSIGYNGKCLLATNRAMYALTNGYNTYKPHKNMVEDQPFTSHCDLLTLLGYMAMSLYVKDAYKISDDVDDICQVFHDICDGSITKKTTVPPWQIFTDEITDILENTTKKIKLLDGPNFLECMNNIYEHSIKANSFGSTFNARCEPNIKNFEVDRLSPFKFHVDRLFAAIGFGKQQLTSIFGKQQLLSILDQHTKGIINIIGNIPRDPIIRFEFTNCADEILMLDMVDSYMKKYANIDCPPSISKLTPNNKINYPSNTDLLIIQLDQPEWIGFQLTNSISDSMLNDTIEYIFNIPLELYEILIHIDGWNLLQNTVWSFQ